MAEGTPELIDVERVVSGWINKYVLTYMLPDGSTYRYESMSRKGPEAYRRELEARGRGEKVAPDAVCVVPITAEGELLLIREFRYPVNSWCIAFPAGLVDPGETTPETLGRELLEETGYALRADLGKDAVEALPQAGLSSTGMTDEAVQVVFAQVEKVADAHPDRGELIKPFLLPIEDVPRFLAENQTPIGTRAQLILEAFARRR